MSSYHYDPKITRAQKEERDADIRGKVEQIRVQFPRAGYRPILHYLKRRGPTKVYTLAGSVPVKRPQSNVYDKFKKIVST